MLEQRLPAEWEAQDAILLTWPHQGTDWESRLDEIIPLYEALAAVLVDYADLVIAAPDDELEDIQRRLEAMTVPLEYVHLFPVPSNDVWARDHGPLTVQTGDGFKLLDFQFNGWGNKFEHQLDNMLTSNLFRQGAFPGAVLESQGWILEGGSVEVDGRGTLLTTSACLLNPNRNPGLSAEDIETHLKAAFGVRKINWLNHGHLEGDDTDSHIDTLARLCPDNVIVYVRCDDPGDSHYAELQAMEEELSAMTDADGRSYRLLPLPWAGAVLSDSGRRLPATYANFLITNNAVLVPQYDRLTDEDALEQLAHAFPGYDVLGIPCAALIEQGGSLHCITMQLPEGVLYPHDSD